MRGAAIQDGPHEGRKGHAAAHASIPPPRRAHMRWQPHSAVTRSFGKITKNSSFEGSWCGRPNN
jgi:hypothetical protein